MKKALLLMTVASIIMNVQAVSSGKIQVLKQGDDVYILDAYNQQNDLLRRIGIRRERNSQVNFTSTLLVPAGSKLTAALVQKGILIHGCSDDSTPWNLNGTYIGANHGCSDARNINAPGHGLTDKDVGSELSDSKGNKFYVIKIADADNFWVLGENTSNNAIWKFKRKINGSTFKTADGRSIKFKKAKMVQLLPACRIKLQKFLLDGKTPLSDNKVTECDFLDIEEEYDIIAPDSLLEYVKKHPGKKADFTAKELASVVTNKIRYRLLPYGACTVYHKSAVNSDIRLGYMGFIQTAQLYAGNKYSQQYYIPKTCAFENEKRKFDFESIQDFSGPMPTNNFMSRNKNIRDPKNLPDRFIQFLCKGNERVVGYAVGYSLTEGMTVPEIRSNNCNNALFLYRSKKTYPHAIDRKMNPVKAGTTLEVLAYRQYFDPQADKDATAIYLHEEGKSVILYMHFHKNVKDKRIVLPQSCIGRKISVVEKTPSLELGSGSKVPAEGISVTVKDNYGYAVLKLD